MIRVNGLDEVIDAIRRIPTSLDTRVVLSEVSEVFSDRLRAATPPGYSGKLSQSVLWEADDEKGIVGFEEGVERAGNPELESVTRPRTRGRSVLRWVPVEELETVLEDSFLAFADEGVAAMESAFADQINGLS